MQRVNKKVKYSVFISLLFLLALAAAAIIGITTQNRNITTTAVTENWSAVAQTAWWNAAGGQNEDAAFVISTPYQLAGLAQLVNTATAANQQDMLGQFFRLGADIDLTGRIWQPIGGGTTADGVQSNTTVPQEFRGVFDGRGHTITMSTHIQKTAANSTAGLFGRIRGQEATVKNLTTTGSINTFVGGEPSHSGFLCRCSFWGDGFCRLCITRTHFYKYNKPCRYNHSINHSYGQHYARRCFWYYRFAN